MTKYYRVIERTYTDGESETAYYVQYRKWWHRKWTFQARYSCKEDAIKFKKYLMEPKPIYVDKVIG